MTQVSAVLRSGSRCSSASRGAASRTSSSVPTSEKSGVLRCQRPRQRHNAPKLVRDLRHERRGRLTAEEEPIDGVAAEQDLPDERRE